MFCRNCGKELAGTPEICATCGAKPVNATAFCRFCGNATTAQDVMCPKCGAAIRIITKSRETSNKEVRGLLPGKTLKILAAVTFVSLYVLFTLPPKTVRPLKAAASDAVMVTTGYTVFPLSAISAFPPKIPRVVDPPGEVIFHANDTQQLTIYAVYKNTTSNNGTGAARFGDVTANSTFQSSNDKIATVTSGGLVQGVARGSANITASYTAAPGSANISSAAQGKVPITVTVNVPVTVR